MNMIFRERLGGHSAFVISVREVPVIRVGRGILVTVHWHCYYESVADYGFRFGKKKNFGTAFAGG